MASRSAPRCRTLLKGLRGCWNVVPHSGCAPLCLGLPTPKAAGVAGSPSPHAPRGASTSQAARRDRGRPPRRATAFTSQVGPLSAPSGQRTPPRGHPVPPPCAPARRPWSRKRRVPTVPGAARGRSRLGSADTTPRAAPRPRPGWRTPAAKRAPGHGGVAAVDCAPALFEPRARRLPSTRPGTRPHPAAPQPRPAAPSPPSGWFAA